MSMKTLGILLIVFGVILVAISLAADAIEIGSGAFGPKQIIGTAIGIIVALVGVWLALRKLNLMKQLALDNQGVLRDQRILEG